jgi:hypothetical protein
MTIGAALADASRLRHRLAQTHFAVAYGSHIRGTATDSDLDLLFVGDSPLSGEQMAWLTAEVRFLHHRHGLRLDEEVAYKAKLYASRDEISDAVNFGGYDVDAAGRLTVPPVLVDPAYLNSAAFKSRLLVNALTSPHVFLGGDIDRYPKYQARAACTAALVALSLLDDKHTLVVPDAVTALISDASGATGEDYLGYTEADRPLLYGLLQAAFAHLASHRVLQPLDGASFRHDQEARRALILRMASQRPHRQVLGGLPRQAAR